MIGFMLILALILALILLAIPHLIWFLLFLFGKIFGFHPAYSAFGLTALGLVVLCWSIMAYGYFIGRWQSRVTSLDYVNNTIPASFNGYKIVHISDLHLSTFDDNKKKLKIIVDKINGLEPDLVCFTGDLVTEGVKEAEPYIDDLRRIRAKDGIVSILGNHDFMIYSFRGRPPAERDEEVDSLTVFERERLGWILLRNENRVIERGDDKITIIGVDNQNCADQGFHTLSRGDLQQAMNGTDGFRILLTHDPSHWNCEVVPDTDIPLTLCGHTHAAQIRIFGWTPAKWVFDQTDGRYDQDGQTLYVNIGLGCTLPLRLGAKQEITLITLSQN